MRIFGWFFAVLFIVACYDNNKNKAIETSCLESSKYTPPAPSKGFEEIYRQPEGHKGYFVSGMSGEFYNLPLPEEHYNGEIKIPQDGEIEVSGRMVYESVGKYDQNIIMNLYIDDEKREDLSRGVSCSSFEREVPNYPEDIYTNYADFKDVKLSVKGGQILSFRRDTDPYQLRNVSDKKVPLFVQNLVVYFKSD